MQRRRKEIERLGKKAALGITIFYVKQITHKIMKKITAYKVFNPDWTCRGFQFEVGKSYTAHGKIELCENGFHACAIAARCFDYYSFDSNNKVAIVELSGKIVGNATDKYAARKIKVVKELSWQDVLSLVNVGKNNTGIENSGDRNSGNLNSGNLNSGDRNSGDWNSGDWNSGDRNSGDRNSGAWNSGNRNSGYLNSGAWNSGNRNSGYLNTNNPKIRIFNKETDVESIDFPSYFYFDLLQWISLEDMTEEEKSEYPQAETTGGYLRKLDYKEAWKLAFAAATPEEIEQTKNLPNFDAKLFFKITGIDYFLKKS
jgi:hypothetical protein